MKESVAKNIIRKMTKEDVSRVAEIHTFGWRSAFRGIVSDEHLFKTMSVAKKTEDLSKTIDDFETYVYDDGLVKAFMTIGKCRDNDKPDSFELWGLFVEPLMTGQGIGSQLISFCEEQARERGFNEICIWTLEENTKGRTFYEQHGYALDGHRKLRDTLRVAEIRYTKHRAPQKEQKQGETK